MGGTRYTRDELVGGLEREEGGRREAGGRREEGGRLSQCSRCAGRGPLTGLCTSSHSEVALSTNLPSMNN